MKKITITVSDNMHKQIAKEAKQCWRTKSNIVAYYLNNSMTIE